jgi:hypothetical protein
MPHAPHWLVVAPSMHDIPVMQAVTPPSAFPPPVVGQQS